jgi:hypothetical protein
VYSDLPGHNAYREGHGRLTEQHHRSKVITINLGFIRACNDNSIQEIHNVFASRYTKSIPQIEIKYNKLGFLKDFAMKSNMQEIYSKQWNSGDLGSRKRIIYCAKVYESTSSIGMSVWWLNVGFLVVAD